MKFLKGIFSKVEQALEPAQWLVSLILVAIILISVFFLFNRNAAARTAWTAWMVLP